MQSNGNSSSQCQLFQLHIDAFLDNELEPARAAELDRHLGRCEACRQELAYAQRLHSAVVSLPILDCSDQALEPVDRLFVAADVSADHQQHEPQSGAAVAWLTGWMSMPLRMAVPAGLALVLILVVGLNQGLLMPKPGTDVAQGSASPTAAPEYTEAEIVKALQDLELALDYLGQISTRTEVMIEDRFLLRKLQETMNASLTTELGDDPNSDSSNGPI